MHRYFIVFYQGPQRSGWCEVVTTGQYLNLFEIKTKISGLLNTSDFSVSNVIELNQNDFVAATKRPN